MKTNLRIKYPKETLPSDIYQHIFTEAISYDDNKMSDKLFDYYAEEYYLLQDALIARINSLINKYLTKRQKQVLDLLLSGETQSSIALILNIQQSAVCKIINGNPIGIKRHGGIKNKLSKIVLNDTQSITIHNKMIEIIYQNC